MQHHLHDPAASPQLKAEREELEKLIAQWIGSSRADSKLRRYDRYLERVSHGCFFNPGEIGGSGVGEGLPTFGRPVRGLKNYF